MKREDYKTSLGQIEGKELSGELRQVRKLPRKQHWKVVLRNFLWGWMNLHDDG